MHRQPFQYQVVLVGEPALAVHAQHREHNITVQLRGPCVDVRLRAGVRLRADHAVRGGAEGQSAAAQDALPHASQRRQSGADSSAAADIARVSTTTGCGGGCHRLVPLTAPGGSLLLRDSVVDGTTLAALPLLSTGAALSAYLWLCRIYTMAVTSGLCDDVKGTGPCVVVVAPWVCAV